MPALDIRGLIIISLLKSIGTWANRNAGVLALLVFVAGILIAGVRSRLRRPRFKIELIPGPTFISSFETGREHDGYKTHRTAIALYLKIANVGSAAASISGVEVGYHNFTFRYTFLWYWLQAAAVLTDFCVNIGDSVKCFPFLIQHSIITGRSAPTYLEPGRDTCGVAYFEQPESWGGFRPRLQGDNKVLIKVGIRDAFGKCHSRTFKLDLVSVDKAREYCSAFGRTYEELSKKPSI
jgi:hypothetical protein